MPRKKKRKYPTKKKTTTKEGYRNYHRAYMRDWRKQRTKKLKDMEAELERLRKQLEKRRRKI